MGEGGGPGPSVIKISDSVFFLINLFYRMPIFYFKENYTFILFQGSRGAPTFFPGGGVQLFLRGGGMGVQLLIPYRNPYNLCFFRVGGGSWPLAPSGWAYAIFGATGCCDKS